MRRIEALCDAFAKMYGALDPQSEAYHLRNPMMLRAFSPKHERDAKGHRKFRTFVAGYENGLLDLKIKCSGHSRAKLTPESTLVDLAHTYGQPTSCVRYLVNFLRHALGNDAVRDDAKLGWFLEDDLKSEEKQDAERGSGSKGDNLKEVGQAVNA